MLLINNKGATVKIDQDLEGSLSRLKRFFYAFEGISLKANNLLF